MRNFANELRRAFGWGWVAAVGIVLVPLFIANMEYLPKLLTEKEDAISLIINGFHKSSIMPIHLFALACPYAVSSLSDIRCGVMKYQLARTGRAPYVCSRFCANAISAATAVLFAQLLFMGICIICFPYPDVGYRLRFSHGEVMETLLYQRPIFYFLVLVALQIPSSIAWSSLSLGVSLYCRNQVVALLTPFLVFTAISVTCVNPFMTNLFRACVLIYDPGLAQYEWTTRLVHYFGFFGAMICVSFMLFYIAVKMYDGSAGT